MAFCKTMFNLDSLVNHGWARLIHPSITVSEFENFKDWDHLIFGAVKNSNKFYLNVLIFGIFFLFSGIQAPSKSSQITKLTAMR